MRDIRSIFSEQEQRIYEKLPIAVAFYLYDKEEVKAILVSDGLCKFLNVGREMALRKAEVGKKERVHKNDLAKIEIAIKEFASGKTETLDFTYRAFSKEEDRYVWHHVEAYFLDLDLDNEARVAMAIFKNVDLEMKHAKAQAKLKIKNEIEYNKVQSIFETLIQEQTEYVAKLDEENEKVSLVASRGNFAGFKEGYDELTFKEYEDFLKNKINIVGAYGGKRLKSCKEYLEYVKEEANATNYIVKRAGKTYYKFVLTFRGQRDNQLYIVVYDTTDLVKKEYSRAEELKKANDSKTEFLSRMSHDIRTPIGAIIATSNFGIDEINDEKAIDYFKEIKNYSNYLLAIMNDVLDIQKLAHNKIKLMPEIFEIAKLNEEVRNIVSKNANKNNIKMDFSSDYLEEFKYIKSDKKRLEQILINLLNNAIKYTPSCGTVKITCSFEKNAKVEYLKYIIEDNGIGMSEKFQKKMFEPFTREENEVTSLKDGSGLGLSIVKNIIDVAGGSIKCKSKLGVGTTFIIQLPMEKVIDKELINSIEKNKPYKLAQNKEKLKGKRVLLVEDMEINRKIATKILMNMGITVTSAVNGKDAVESVKNNCYNLILMDSRMPVMNGLDATVEIRKFDQKIPIIGLSANAFLEDINKSLAVGMNDYLAKPIDRKKLEEVLLKYC